VSQPPQAGSKYGATQKYQNRTDTSHSFPYIWLSSGDWLIGVVKGGGVSSSSFLGGFRGWSLGLEAWTPLKVVVLIWLASHWGEIGARILRGSYADARAYVEKVKLVWRWMILNSLFRFCIWHTGRLPSLIYDASKSWSEGKTQREASSFSYVGLVFYLFSCVESSLYVLFWEFWCTSFQL
jgi:hypothetical protein